MHDTLWERAAPEIEDYQFRRFNLSKIQILGLLHNNNVNNLHDVDLAEFFGAPTDLYELSMIIEQVGVCITMYRIQSLQRKQESSTENVQRACSGLRTMVIRRWK
jgi:hypothetical protein